MKNKTNWALFFIVLRWYYSPPVLIYSTLFYKQINNNSKKKHLWRKKISLKLLDCIVVFLRSFKKKIRTRVQLICQMPVTIEEVVTAKYPYTQRSYLHLPQKKFQLLEWTVCDCGNIWTCAMWDIRTFKSIRLYPWNWPTKKF